MSAVAERWREATDLYRHADRFRTVLRAGDALAAALEAERARVAVLEARLRLIAGVAWEGAPGALERVRFLAEELVPFEGVEDS